jgi:hypothetical protein
VTVINYYRLTNAVFIQNRAPVVEEVRDVPQTVGRPPQPAVEPQFKLAETSSIERTVLTETPNQDQSQTSGNANSDQTGLSDSLEPVHANSEQPGQNEAPTSVPAGPSGVPSMPRTSTCTRRPHEDCVICDTAHQGSSHNRLIAEDTNLWALVSASRRETGDDDDAEEIPRPQPSSPPLKAAYMNGEELQAAIDEGAENAELEEFKLVSNRSIALMEVKTCLIDTLLV